MFLCMVFLCICYPKMTGSVNSKGRNMKCVNLLKNKSRNLYLISSSFVSKNFYLTDKYTGNKCMITFQIRSFCRANIIRAATISSGQAATCLIGSVSWGDTVTTATKQLIFTWHATSFIPWTQG